MTELYYTCPIKAAYMTQEFGVKFKQYCYFPSIHSTEIKLFPVGFNGIIAEISHFRPEFAYENRFIVAKVSEEIFEPIEGDIAFYSTYLLMAVNHKGRWVNLESGEALELDAQKGLRIIMRNNKQFFIPNKEELK